MAKVLVTGGGGFLATAIIKCLRQRDDEVFSISRGHYPALAPLGVTQIAGDISHAEALSAAVKDMDIVFHVAAKAGVWGAYDDYYKINVEGTRNVINACRQHGVTRLIYTSSPSVVFDGNDQENWDESAPYPEKFLAAYPQTKALAEQLVNAANSPELATVSLRPHLIWGPGDNHLVPRILNRGRAGRIRTVGDSSKLVDSVYVDNAAQAHIQAADRLHYGSPVAGKNYFITNDEPMPMHELMNGILAAGGIGPVRKSIPAVVAYGVGALLEGLYTLLRSDKEPMMTRFVAKQLATAHYYNISAAKRDLGYQPKVTIREGLAQLAQALRQDPA